MKYYFSRHALFGWCILIQLATELPFHRLFSQMIILIIKTWYYKKRLSNLWRCLKQIFFQSSFYLKHVLYLNWKCSRDLQSKEISILSKILVHVVVYLSYILFIFRTKSQVNIRLLPLSVPILAIYNFSHMHKNTTNCHI